MFTAALINSVADSSIIVHTETMNKSHANVKNSKESRPYSLRKVRRTSGGDLKRLEHFQTTRDGGMARASGKFDENAQSDLSLPIPTVFPVKTKSEKQTATRNRRSAKTLNHSKVQIKSATSSIRAAVLPITSVPNPLSVPIPHTLLPSESVLPCFSAPIPCPLSVPATGTVLYHLESEPVADTIESKPKVTFSDISSPRDRGFSIDLDRKLVAFTRISSSIVGKRLTHVLFLIIFNSCT
jgi:hypothetical protein